MATKSDAVLPLAKAADLTSLRLSHRCVLLVGCFLVAYVYGLDYTLRATYQSTAAASFGDHSLIATINVARFAMAAAAQPLFARSSDRFGRLEVTVVSLVLYVVGTIVQACAMNIGTLAAGSVIYQLGYTGLQLMVEIGAITMLVACFPLIGILFYTRHERAALVLHDQEEPARAGPPRSRWGRVVDLTWELDLAGFVLLLAACALVLLPLTIAGGVQSEWRQAHIIVMLVVGALCIPGFVFWEMKIARCPLLKKDYLASCTIIGCLGVSVLLNACWLQGNYLYTVLYVSYGRSVASATRVSNLYSFVACLSGIGAGLVVRRIRRLKIMMISGVCLFAAGFGIVIRYRGGPSEWAGMVGGQVVLGVAGGFFTYPGQVAIQAAVEHQYLAVVTSLYLASYYVGAAICEALAGAIWTQTLPSKLLSTLGNATLADAVYGSPFAFASSYPIGTRERTAVIAAYRHSQLLLTVTALALCAPLVVSVGLIKDVRLGKDQCLGVSAEEGEKQGEGEVARV